MTFSSHTVQSLRLLMIVALITLTSCAAQLNSILPKIFIKYDTVASDFEHGRIMQARNNALEISKEHPDYERTRKLLKDKIEPARKRLLNHYSGKAKRAANQKRWAKAAQYYAEAVRLSLDSKPLSKQLTKMQLRVRQVRMNDLIKLRREEDQTLQSWIKNYEKPPVELMEKDAPYMRKRRHHQELLEEWEDSRYLEASRYLRKGYPEVAWIEIESHLRMNPDSGKGRKLAKKIKEALPKGLTIPAPSRHKQTSRAPTRVKPKTKPLRPPSTKQKPSTSTTDSQVTERGIRKRMQQGKWLEAKEMAIKYRNSDNTDTSTLVAEVDQGIKREAERAFKKGQVAFAKEKLEEAVTAWRRAVDLMPDDTAYWEQLQRAEQLQERLSILRNDTKPEGK